MSSAWMRDALARDVPPMKGTSTVAQKAALMVLAWHHHPDHESVSIGTRRISEQCGMTRQATMRALSALVSSGILARDLDTGGRAAYRLIPVTPHDRTGSATEPVTQHDRSHDATGNATLPGVVTQRNRGWSHGMTGVVTPRDHVEIRDRGDLGDPPTPHGGDGPDSGSTSQARPQRSGNVSGHSQAEPEGRDPDIPTAGDRLAAKEHARASAASAAGVATGPGPAPTLSGAERDTPDDIINTIVWYSNASPNAGGASATHKQRAREVILGTSCAEFIAAVQAIAATDGSSWPRPHIVKARIGTDRMSRIAREKSARAESERKRHGVQRLKVLA